MACHARASIASIQQHIALTLRVGNIGWPAGEWVNSGKSNVTMSTTGQIAVQLDQA